MSGMFETMQPPTACGTDNHVLLLGLGACLPAKARTAPRRIGHPSISGERPMSKEQTPCHPVLRDLPVGITGLNAPAGGTHDPLSFGGRL